jgi:hypothetical protein
MENIKIIIERIFQICLLIAFISILFDVSITYMSYKKDINLFLNMEECRSLVGELKENVPFFRTISINIMLLSPPILFFIINYFKKDFSKLYIFLLILIIPLLLIGSFLHIEGGLSWLQN